MGIMASSHSRLWRERVGWGEVFGRIVAADPCHFAPSASRNLRLSPFLFKKLRRSALEENGENTVNDVFPGSGARKIPRMANQSFKVNRERDAGRSSGRVCATFHPREGLAAIPRKRESRRKIWCFSAGSSMLALAFCGWEDVTDLG